MKVGIYGRGLANRAGIGRYTRELIKSLAYAEPDSIFQIFGGPDDDRTPQGRNLHQIQLHGSTDRLWEEQIGLPKAIENHRPVLLHNPDFTLPLRLGPRTKSIITIHDVAYLRLPKSNSWKSRVLLTTLVPSSIRRADAIIAVSEFTKREIISAYSVLPEKIHVIPNGVDSSFHPPTPNEVDAIREKYGLPIRDIVLYIGAIEPRKNLVRLSEAIAGISGATLVIGGKPNRSGTEILHAIKQVLGANVRFLGFVPDEDLPGLYGAATVFAYPSVYEGFGLQPLEALACGTPVACSSAASLPEVVGDSALTFDPLAVDEMKSAIKTLLSDRKRRECQQRSGLERATEFGWARIAKQTLDLYRSVIDSEQK